MPMPTSDLKGRVFGRLTVLYRVPSTARDAVWLCRCECGAQVPVRSNKLRTGNTQSCGCYRREVTAPAQGRKGRTHGKTRTPTYSVWRGMLARCYTEDHIGYRWYGARGIRVCNRWASFECFLEDMGEQPDGMQIDRIDNDGNYEPGNCRWATPTQNMRNRSDTVRHEFMGQNLTAPEWAEVSGIYYPTLKSRLYHGWSIERALTTPIRGGVPSV